MLKQKLKRLEANIKTGGMLDSTSAQNRSNSTAQQVSLIPLPLAARLVTEDQGHVHINVKNNNKFIALR